MKFTLSLAICFLIAAAAPAGAQTARPQMQTFDTSAGPVKITPIEHASTLIEAGGKVIYVDPAKTPNFPSNFTGLPPADLILVSDIHGDHMDPASIALLSKADTVIIAPPSVVHGQAAGQWRIDDVG